VIAGQSFEANEDGITVVKFNKALVDKAKREFQKNRSELIGDTHQSAEKLINCSEAPDLAKVKRLHNENLNKQILETK